MAEILTAALPVFVTTILCAALVPTACVPNDRLAGDTERCPVAAVVPFPVNATVSVGFAGSLLVIDRLPVALPAAAGVNVTAKLTDCPAAIVAGVVIPPIVKSVPLKLRTEMVKLLDPLLDRTKLLVLLTPIESVPKSMLAGLTDNCALPLTADAERFTTTGVLPLSPETVSVPVTFPAA